MSEAIKEKAGRFELHCLGCCCKHGWFSIFGCMVCLMLAEDEVRNISYDQILTPRGPWTSLIHVMSHIMLISQVIQRTFLNPQNPMHFSCHPPSEGRFISLVGMRRGKTVSNSLEIHWFW